MEIKDERPRSTKLVLIFFSSFCSFVSSFSRTNVSFHLLAIHTSIPADLLRCVILRAIEMFLSRTLVGPIHLTAGSREEKFYFVLVIIWKGKKLESLLLV